MIHDAMAAVDRLGAAFAARDLAAALECFAPGADIEYAGSEAGERAEGRTAVAALFGALFARSEAYSWRAREASLRRYADCAYVLVEADGVAQTDAGPREEFAYRLSGVLEAVDGEWRWRVCQGSEPS